MRAARPNRPRSRNLRSVLTQARSGALGCSQGAVYFINTNEFQTRSRTLIPGYYAEVMYQTLLSRYAETDAILNFQNYSLQGTMSKADLVRQILRSAEFDSLCRSKYGFPAGAGTFSGLTEF